MNGALNNRWAWPRRCNPHPGKYNGLAVHRTTASCDKDPITGFNVKFSSRAMAQ